MQIFLSDSLILDTLLAAEIKFRYWSHNVKFSLLQNIKKKNLLRSPYCLKVCLSFQLRKFFFVYLFPLSSSNTTNTSFPSIIPLIFDIAVFIIRLTVVSSSTTHFFSPRLKAGQAGEKKRHDKWWGRAPSTGKT